MPSSDKNTKVSKTEPCSELYLQSRGRERPGNISQLNVVRVVTGWGSMENGHLMHPVE